MAATASGIDNRTKLVKQALALGAKVLKSDSVEDIKKKIKERIEKPGLPGMEALTSKQIEKADGVRKQLYVINRTDDCFGVLFDKESEACTQRCAVNSDCVIQLIKNSDVLLADERARAKEEAKWKGNGQFEPAPLLAYVKNAKPEEPAKKTKAAEPKEVVGTISDKSKVKVKMDAETAANADEGWNTLLEVLVDMAGDIKTYGDFKDTVLAVAKDCGYKLGTDKDAGVKKLALDLRKLGWISIQ